MSTVPLHAARHLLPQVLTISLDIERSSHEHVRIGSTRADEKVWHLRYHHGRRMLPLWPHLSLVRISSKAS